MIMLFLAPFREKMAVGESKFISSDGHKKGVINLFSYLLVPKKGYGSGGRIALSAYG